MESHRIAGIIPVFGVVEDETPHCLHVFEANGRTSLCGEALRPCETQAEAELTTCPSCSDEAMQRERAARTSG